MKQDLFFFLSILCLPVGFCEETLKCSEEDDECIRIGTERFFYETAMGDSTRNLKRTDPLLIDSLYYNLSKKFEMELLFEYINITGLKNVSVTDLSVDKNAKIANYIFDPDLEIAANLTTTFAILPEKVKLTGLVKGILHLRIFVKYPFEEIVDSEGVKTYVIGKESTVSEIRAKPFYQLDAEYLEKANQDPVVTEIRKINLGDTKTLFEELTPKLAEVIASVLIGNMRESAKTGPGKNFLISPVNKTTNKVSDISTTEAKVLHLTESNKPALKEDVSASNTGISSIAPVVAETTNPAEAKSPELKVMDTKAPILNNNQTVTNETVVRQHVSSNS